MIAPHQSTLGDRALQSRCLAITGIGTQVRLFPKRVCRQQYSQRLENDFYKKNSSNQVPAEKEQIEHSALGQAQPKAAVKTPSLVVPENSLRVPQRLSSREKCQTS
jgi:hypothetical protein